MITILTSAGFVGVLIWWWARWHADLSELSVRYMCLGPFLPLVSLFNHNFNADRFGTIVRTAPIYAGVVLLGLSVIEHQRHGNRLRLRFEGGCLALYIIVSLAQTPFSVEPAWALTAWSFSAPGYLLFLWAGQTTTLESIERHRRRFALTVLAFVGVQVSLIAYGLLTGKATDLSQTRNFGSVWAGNTMLAFLVLFGGIAWTAIRNSSALAYLFLAVSLLAMVLSLSRTALMVLVVYAVFLTVAPRARRGRIIVAAAIAIGTLSFTFIALRSRLGLDVQLVGNWLARFQGGGLEGTFKVALAARQEEFAPYLKAVLMSNPLFGTGYGTFRSYSIYSDAHNLLLTEAFENSLSSAVLVAFALGLPRAVVALFQPALRPIGASIIGFFFVAQITGGMLSYRSWDNYYATYPGWILFFMVGALGAAQRSRAPNLPASAIPHPGTVRSAP